jgi:5-methylthioribose kinase
MWIYPIPTSALVLPHLLGKKEMERRLLAQRHVISLACANHSKHRVECEVQSLHTKAHYYMQKQKQKQK